MSDPALNRRELLSGRFLRGLFGALEPAPRAARVADTFSRALRTIPVHRPPGAVDEASFLAGCTRCGDCLTACPHQAITLAPERLRAAAGTPMIAPAEAACQACPDTPCITACVPAVLQRAAGAPVPVMATARIVTTDCLAHQGTTCVSCVERCPVPGAIALVGGRPVIDAAVCVGCGVCAHVCPAPRSAVAILPLAVRT